MARKIFDLYINADSTNGQMDAKAIVNHLNDKGMKCRGRQPHGFLIVTWTNSLGGGSASNIQEPDPFGELLLPRRSGKENEIAAFIATTIITVL